MSQYLKTNLRHMRKQHRMTVTQGAAVIDTRRGTYSAWEEGRSQPSNEKLIAIADWYGVTIDDLLREDLTLVYVVKWHPEIVKGKG